MIRVRAGAVETAAAAVATATATAKATAATQAAETVDYLMCHRISITDKIYLLVHFYLTIELNSISIYLIMA